MSSLFGSPSSLATSKNSCWLYHANNGRAKIVDVLSSADAVSALRPEEDVAELLWMGSAELNQAARSRKKALSSLHQIFSGNRVEVLNHQPGRLAA